MTQTITIWHRANGRLGWAQKLTKATPLWSTQKLGLLCNQKGFDKWDTIGISTIKDFIHKGKICTFSELQTTYSLAPKEIFCYLQIQHALTTNISDLTFLPDSSPLEDRLLAEPIQSKAISYTYRKLQ